MRATTQHTIETPVVVEGVGVHSGARTRVRLTPGAPDTGVVFVRTDVAAADAAILAHVAFLGTTSNSTTLSNQAGVHVATVEHLLAAAMALEIDNLVAEIDGPEMPILDGSALGFVEALDDAGRRPQFAPRRVLRVLRRVEVVQGGRSAVLEPMAGGFELDVTIRYDDPVIGVQRRAAHLTPGVFRNEIAPARTFGLLAELEGLHARGLARGASLDNTVAVDSGRVVNPEGLRYADEFVRHKMIDVIGDLALAGAPIEGRLVGDQCGHALNTRLVRELLAAQDAYAVVVLGAGDA